MLGLAPPVQGGIEDVGLPELNGSGCEARGSRLGI
jgi:hypothetical protein